MNGTARPKVTVKVNYNASSTPPSRTNSPRPPSPMKRTSSFAPPPVSATALRAKAKVNSSATLRRSPSVVSATPRAGSPTKLVRAQNVNLSPTFQPRVPAVAPTSVKVTLRPQTPVSAPGTPEVRLRPPTLSETGKNPGPRARDGSFSLHHAMSFSSLQTASHDSNASPRIRSKISNLSKPENENESPLPLHPSTRTAQARVRSPSSSSNLSQTANYSPPPQPYPITTGSPAANPHRYGAAPPTSNGQHHYQGLAPLSNDTHITTHRPKFGGTVKVDLGPTPPPPLSPPSSAVSFSSKSSLSYSSTSQVEGSLHGQSEKRRASSATEIFKPSSSHFGEPLDKSSISNSGPDSDEEVKVMVAAKTNRKIADLEITNRSLLSINSSLEAAKNKQAREIRELRRKLRESRLILPPRTYLAVKSTMGPGEDDEEYDEDEDSELEDAAVGDGDEIYKRVKLMLEGLISSGKKALETKIDDFAEGGKGGAKVLTAEEVQSWHRSNKVPITEPEIDNLSEVDDNMSMSQANTSMSSSVNGDDDDDRDQGDMSFFNGSFFKHLGPA